MCPFHGCQGLLKLGVALMTLSFTLGLICTQCTDMKDVQILKNTANGFNINIDPLMMPRSLQCESAKNGETAEGVTAVECPINASGSSQEFRCVHYYGFLDISFDMELGSAAGEVKLRYEGTYKDCFLDDISVIGCVTQNSPLPENNQLRIVTLSSMPIGAPYVKNAIVEFNGTMCVSDINGTIDTVSNTKSNATMTACNILVAFLFFFIRHVV